MLRSQEKFTCYKFPIFLQLLDIILDLEYFFDIEERRRRRLAIVFSGDSMEYHREVFWRQVLGFQEAVDDGWITTWQEITTIELLIRKPEDSFVRPEVFYKFDHTEKLKD